MVLVNEGLLYLVDRKAILGDFSLFQELSNCTHGAKPDILNAFRLFGKFEGDRAGLIFYSMHIETSVEGAKLVHLKENFERSKGPR